MQEVQIQLEARGCGFTCPRYRLTLRGDGEVSFSGQAYTAAEGEQVGSIDRPVFIALLETVYSEGFFALADEYRFRYDDLQVSDDGDVEVVQSYRTDRISRVITIRIGAYSKSVWGYDRIPEAFLEIERRILAVPGVSDWIGGGA